VKRLVLALIPLAVVVSSCAVGQVTFIDDVGPLGADVHGTAATSNPASLELMLVAKQGGTPTQEDNDIVSATDQNSWSNAANGCFAVTPSAGSSYAYVISNIGDSVSQYTLGAGGALSAMSPATVATGHAPVGVAVSPDGGSVYVTNTSDDFDNDVSQYDVGAGGALSAKSPAAVAAGAQPRGVAVSPDGGSVYVTNSGERSVSQYDVGAGGALSPKSPPAVAAGDFPFEVAVSPLARMPTNKDQCKHNGWRAFGVFKNQGDCVSFVATGGKNPPDGPPR
jgi:sugar lactone lactonase YvrE